MNHARQWYVDACSRPEWQRKRLKILERDNWQCQVCSTKTRTLVVHHYYYKRGAEPWEYPDNALSTMCKNCHAEASAKDYSAQLLDGLFHLLGSLAVEWLIDALENRTTEDPEDFTPPCAAPFEIASVFEWVENASCWLSPRYAQEQADDEKASAVYAEEQAAVEEQLRCYRAQEEANKQ